MCLAYDFDMLSMGVCTHQALADVRSTGAGIKCLYCRHQAALSTVQHLYNINLRYKAEMGQIIIGNVIPIKETGT